jgi:hypothetical protein
MIFARVVNGRTERIGTGGAVARAVVGATLVGLELFWRHPKWWDPLVAIAITGLIVGVMAIRVRVAASRWTRRGLSGTPSAS